MLQNIRNFELMDERTPRFNRTKRLGFRLGIALLLLSVTRILFYLFNLSHFAHVSLTDFLSGAWFDCITIALYFSPFVLIHLIPVQHERSFKIKEQLSKILFLATIALVLAMNLMDFEYFKYTNKRSTADLFSILSAGNDFSQLATTFVKDFWILIVLLALFLWITERLYRKTQRIAFSPDKLKPVLMQLVLVIPITLVVARGGFQLKPIGIMEAAQFTTPENTALVLNTPFTMVKSFGKERLEQKHFFSEAKEKHFFDPVHQSHPQHILPEKTNVMIIILESFGNEWAGPSTNRASYTPFFDSLLNRSLTFEYGVANGKKSIEAVPAIIASIPTLMDNPYISSPYGNNRLESLASILKEKGYSTAFYHGATNGSMRFDGFAAQAGFDHYYGRFEYNNDKHFDKTWGILDEYFNPWTAKQLSKLKAPFFGTLFTLSSHHPYYIPPHYRKKAKKGPHPICASINYGDYALKKFFDEAKKHSWYKNTLFVLVADHTPATNSPEFSAREMMYRIPIAFYDPSGRLPAKREKRIFQQLDIMPTVLDLLNINCTYYSYGNSLYSKEIPEGLTYLEGTYQYYFNSSIFYLSDEKARNLLESGATLQSTPLSPEEKNHQEKYALNRLKAIIQRYNRDLISNKTAVE
jgi:phosphoglycerol transferase MdoB-like AlkP superfamily enzyme